jgi:excisionase family DNA binding protein
MSNDTERLTRSVSEVARALGISESTVRREIRAGRIPAIRVGGRVLILEQGFLSRILAALGETDPDDVRDRHEDQVAADRAERDAERARDEAIRLRHADAVERQKSDPTAVRFA